MPRVFLVGVALGAGLVILGVVALVVGESHGDGTTELLGVINLIVGATFIARNSRAELDAEEDRQDRDELFRRADSGIGVPTRSAPLAPDPRQRVEIVQCPSCGAFEEATGANFCRRCGRPMPHASA